MTVVQPHLDHETELWRAGYRRIAGVDEAGRGALAGPVVAAAVVLPCAIPMEGVWAEVRDSKLLRAERRTELDAQIREQAAAWAVGIVAPTEIDRIGIAAATRAAMIQAIYALGDKTSKRDAPEKNTADYLLIDWVRLAQCPLPQRSFAKADQVSVSVAAASILAKVTRDTLMVELDVTYPAYGFASNKGYGAKTHLCALAEWGPCPMHRHSFAPIARRASLFDLSATDDTQPASND
jgi:ribonuclease HII